MRKPADEFYYMASNNSLYRKRNQYQSGFQSGTLAIQPVRLKIPIMNWIINKLSLTILSIPKIQSYVNSKTSKIQMLFPLTLKNHERTCQNNFNIGNSPWTLSVWQINRPGGIDSRLEYTLMVLLWYRCANNVPDFIFDSLITG